METEISQCHLKPFAFTNLTDHVFQLILTRTDPQLAKVCVHALILMTAVNQLGVNVYRLKGYWIGYRSGICTNSLEKCQLLHPTV